MYTFHISSLVDASVAYLLNIKASGLRMAKKRARHISRTILGVTKPIATHRPVFEAQQRQKTIEEHQRAVEFRRQVLEQNAYLMRGASNGIGPSFVSRRPERGEMYAS